MPETRRAGASPSSRVTSFVRYWATCANPVTRPRKNANSSCVQWKGTQNSAIFPSSEPCRGTRGGDYARNTRQELATEVVEVVDVLVVRKQPGVDAANVIRAECWTASLRQHIARSTQVLPRRIERGVGQEPQTPGGSQSGLRPGIQPTNRPS